MRWLMSSSVRPFWRSRARIRRRASSGLTVNATRAAAAATVGTRSVKTPSDDRQLCVARRFRRRRELTVQRGEIEVAFVVKRRLGVGVQAGEVEVALEVVDVKHRRGDTIRRAGRRQRRRELGLAAAVEPVDGDDPRSSRLRTDAPVGREQLDHRRARARDRDDEQHQQHDRELIENSQAPAPAR